MKKLALLLCISIQTFSQWNVQQLDSLVSFRSIALSPSGCVWIGGSNNTISHTCDNGITWKNQHIESPYTLDFRGIAAIDEHTIIAMSAGTGDTGAAKIYRTKDKGASWDVVFTDSRKEVFMDGLKFFNEKEGMVYGDPIQNHLFVARTKDGGETWRKEKLKNRPKVEEGEASYAASNSNMIIYEKKVWVATQQKIYSSRNRGKTWKQIDLPISSGKTSGVFGLYNNGKVSFAVGGDYVNDKASYKNTLFSKGGGVEWIALTCKPLGLKEAVLPVSNAQFLLIGTSGTTLFNSATSTCAAIDTLSFHTGVCNEKYCFAAGGKGRVGIWKK